MDLRGSSPKIKGMSKWLSLSQATVDTDAVTDPKTSSEKVSERVPSRARNYKEICSARPRLPNDQL